MNSQTTTSSMLFISISEGKTAEEILGRPMAHCTSASSLRKVTDVRRLT